MCTLAKHAGYTEPSNVWKMKTTAGFRIVFARSCSVRDADGPFPFASAPSRNAFRKRVRIEDLHWRNVRYWRLLFLVCGLLLFSFIFSGLFIELFLLCLSSSFVALLLLISSLLLLVFVCFSLRSVCFLLLSSRAIVVDSLLFLVRCC